MPLPTPNIGESQDDFISRCMSSEAAMEDFPDKDQRLAVCFRQWREERSVGEPQTKAFLAVEIKNEDRGEVEAVFSRFDMKDLDNDWTLPGAFEDGAKVRISAYGHGSWMGELPVGRGVIKATAKDARLLGKFFVSTQHGRDTFETVKEMGELQQWSYSLDDVEEGTLTDELREHGVTRVLKRIVVHEVSPVFKGAGIDTQTVSIKAYNERLEEERVELEKLQAREVVIAEQRQDAEAEYLKFIRTSRRLGG